MTRYRIAPAAGAGTGLAAGLWLRAPVAVGDPALLRLVLFMVAMKAALVLGLTAAAIMRLRRPGPYAGYAGAVAIAAVAPGLILGHPGAGATCFYAGLALFVAIAWRDRSGWAAAYAARAISIRSRRGAAPIAHTNVPPRGTSVQDAPSSIGSLTSSSPVGVGL